ncbi:hypothetical protein ACFQ6H_21235 [Rhodococcus sp. NPDC056506]|uniref:hypothetical protein n=1 Tax=Rhodococcus sp. NPDC056506 TaxID=3345844 RepID=UPI003670B912
MAKPKFVPFNDEQRIKAFVLRARRILSHSLWREQRALMDDLIDVPRRLTIRQDHETGERTRVVQQVFPDEELFESLTARVRLLAHDGDQLHYRKVLNSIAALVPADKFPDHIEPIETWQAMWDEVASRTGEAQAYSVVTDQGVASDDDLTYAWIYHDIVHADDKENEAKGLGVEERYKAATGVVARIVDLTHVTLLLVQELIEAGVLEVDPELFERQVVVTKTVFEQKVVRAHRAPAGTALPTDVDAPDTDWQSIEEGVETYLKEPSSCDVWMQNHSPKSFTPVTLQTSGQVIIE